MSERIFKRFRGDENNELSTDEWPATTNRINEKRKSVKHHEKVDVRTFLPRAKSVAAAAQIKSNNTIFGCNENDEQFSYRYNEAMRLKQPQKLGVLKGAGRWKPCDDLLLVISVLQLNDLDIVYASGKFSCKFTFGEVQNRWNALLHNEVVSTTSRAAISKLHPEQRAAVHRRAPFSLAEEDLLCDISSTDNPNLKDFENLLEKFAETFYAARSGKSLQKHWTLLRDYQMLCDQRPTNKLNGLISRPTNFSDAETERVEESETAEPMLNGYVDQELKLWDQQIKRRTRLLEDELGHWMQLLDIPRGDTNLKPKFDAKTFAVLRGKHLRFAMRKRLISFGRSTMRGEIIDVNLSLEGPAFKISRFQGTIELRSDGIFIVSNFGKHAFFVDGKPVLTDRMATLFNNSVFEIAGITLIFLTNKELIEEICFSESLQTDTD